METKTIIAVFAEFFTIAAFVFGCVALALPTWIIFDLANMEIGLFRTCVDSGVIKLCVDTETDDAMFLATKWLTFSAVVIIGITIFIGLLLLCLKKPCLALTARAFDILGGVCCLVSVCMTAYMLNSSSEVKMFIDFGVAFILAIVCMALAIIAGVMFAFAKPKKQFNAGRVMNAPI